MHSSHIPAAPSAEQGSWECTPASNSPVTEADSSNPKGEASRESQSDPGDEFIVGWEDPEDEDPENPRNWPQWRKWANIGVIATIAFLVPLVSSMLAPAVQQVMRDFGTTSKTFPTFAVSIFVLGFACGPLLLAPLSEVFGRVIVYNVTNVLFVGFTAMCALSWSESMLLTFRFLSGFAGVATVTIGPGTIADMIPRERRGKAVSIWAMGTILGPTVGPTLGGYVTQTEGWRWMFWSVSIAIAVVAFIALIVLKETYPSVLLERKAARLRRSTGNPNYCSKLATDETFVNLMRRSICRPTKMLIFCPIVTVMCTYVAILYGTLYLLFATYSFVFKEVYGYSTLAAGLVFLPGGLGTLLGLLYIGTFSDRTIRRRAAAGKTITPEDRLPLVLTLPGALTFPIGLFIYGWTVEEHVHWIVPQIGTAITGFGSIIVFTSIQTYLIDAFEEYAASVIGANAVLRGTVGAFLPLTGLTLYDSLGWGWGNALLGFVALAFAPLPWIFGKYGARIRNLKHFQVEL